MSRSEHCENEKIKTEIFNYYQKQKAVSLEKIETSDFQFNGIKAPELLKHLSVISGVDEKQALEKLPHMDIKDLTGLPVCHEIVLKIYAAVQTAAQSELVVLNDFLKNESREFEKAFLSLLLFLEKSGKKIIYLSTQIFQTQSMNDLDEKIKVEKFKTLPINLHKISLR